MASGDNESTEVSDAAVPVRAKCPHLRSPFPHFIDADLTLFYPTSFFLICRVLISRQSLLGVEVAAAN